MLLNFKVETERIIFEAYRDGVCSRKSVSKDARSELSELSRIARRRDPIGNTNYFITLNREGEEAAGLMMKKYGYKQGPERGMAVESRVWLQAEEVSVEPQEIVDAWMGLSRRAGVPLRSRKSKRGIHISCASFDDLIVSMDRITNWGESRDLDTLKHELSFTDAEVWLWGVYLDNPDIRASLRALARSEILIWDHS